jgi:hypothetical protein
MRLNRALQSTVDLQNGGSWAFNPNEMVRCRCYAVESLPPLCEGFALHFGVAFEEVFHGGERLRPLAGALVGLFFVG